jgi:hypothetical protein
MSTKGDFRKLRKQAEAQGFRVVEAKEYYLFYPPMPEGADRLDERYQPCRIGHSPSSQRQILNFRKCLERRGLR